MLLPLLVLGRELASRDGVLALASSATGKGFAGGTTGWNRFFVVGVVSLFWSEPSRHEIHLMYPNQGDRHLPELCKCERGGGTPTIKMGRLERLRFTYWWGKIY